MKDMNIAKLTAVDLPLFNGIMSDLFPGTDTPVMDYSKVNCTVHFLKRNIDRTVIVQMSNIFDHVFTE